MTRKAVRIGIPILTREHIANVPIVVLLAARPATVQTGTGTVTRTARSSGCSTRCLPGAD